MDQELTYKWIQERLRDLHSGRLTEKDKARLQEIARQDPFVADALEGFDAHPDVVHADHLERLTAKINLQQRPRRRWLIPNLTVTAIAASVMLIIATYAVITRMNVPEEESRMVILSPDSLMMEDTALGDAVVWNEKIEMSSEEESHREEKLSRESDRSLDKTIPPSGSGTIATGSAKYDADEDKKNEDIVTAPTSVVEEVVVATPDPPAGIEAEPASTRSETTESLRLRDEGFYANQMDPGLMARRVTGRVLDTNGQPLIGAGLLVRNTNLGVTSDINGRFELYLPLPQSEVDITYSGYKEKTLPLQQGVEDVVITLDAASSQLESTLAGKAATSRSKETEAKDASASEQQQNNTSFLAYLKTNSRFPLRENYYSPGKQVTIEFTIPENGKPEQIKILTTSGDSKYDEEAIRLIRRGPEWRCEDEGYPCRMRYTIYFQ